MAQPTFLPGGARLAAFGLPSGLPFVDVVPEGSCPAFFRPGGMSIRPMRTLQQINPVTGNVETWKHMGRPILFQGDLATVKRVRRVARMAKRSSGR